MPDETTRYRFVGSHADDLASGQQLHPGEYVNLDADAEEANAALIEGGALIDAPEAEPEAEPEKPRSTRKPTTTKEG